MNLKKMALVSLLAATFTLPVLADNERNAFIIIGNQSFSFGGALQISGTVSTTVADFNKNKQLENTGWGLIVAGTVMNLMNNAANAAELEHVNISGEQLDLMANNMLAEADLAGKYPDLALSMPIAEAAGELDMGGATIEEKLNKLVEITEVTASGEAINMEQLLGDHDNAHNRDIVTKLELILRAPKDNQ